jgi:hypothetical protein
MQWAPPDFRFPIGWRCQTKLSNSLSISSVNGSAIFFSSCSLHSFTANAIWSPIKPLSAKIYAFGIRRCPSRAMRAIISIPTELRTNCLFLARWLVERTKENDVVSSDNVVTRSSDLICHNQSMTTTQVYTVDCGLTLSVR